ncbi:Dynactin subunit 1 [Phytophthora citrophthora]|uniref:Dynactin subunit 1 n=1 Tax=Phytophthora citrophthora TaxID=4793 RepID=A0AAD9LKV9_9STRA|nr:Dynactin subunit 1 [Phytophthora citrophthora]
MLVSNNDEEPTLAEANRPPDAKAGDIEVETEWARDDVHGLALSLKSPLAHEMAVMLRPQEQTKAASNEDEAVPASEDDDLPILESNRPSCANHQETVMIDSTVDEPVDRLSDSVPEGELHVWVYEARQLSAQWPLTDAVYNEHKLSVRCTLLGAVQQSPCNISGNKSNPVWRTARDGARDGMGGHFAWALGQPEETAGEAGAGVEASECKLEIDVVCGTRTVASASVALEDLLLSSKARAFEEDASDGSGKVIRLSPHWLPLAGNDAGLLQISLEFVPVPSRESCELMSIRSSGTKTLQENDDDEPTQNNAELMDQMAHAHQRTARFEPHELVEACRAVPWLDQRDEVPQQDEEHSKVIVSRSGGVTMYIPTQGDNTPPKSKSLRSPPLAPKTTSFGLRAGGEQEQLMDKQLWDLYYFGISDEAPEAGKVRDSEGFTHTMSMTSDLSNEFSDLTSRSGASMYSRHASTCASDVLAYNELIQDMESAMKSMKEETPPSSNQDRSESENQLPTQSKSPASSPPKIHLKLRRLSRPNISKGIDRIQSLWQEAKARASSSSNGSNSPKERRKSDSSPIASPVACHPQCRTPPPVRGEGVVLFDPQLLPVRLPYQRSSSRDHALEETTKAERVAAAGPRRRSLPINTFSLQHRQEMLLQQQRKRSQRPQFGLQPSLLASVDPPLLSRARSDSLHSLTDVYLPKTGDMHGVEVTTPSTNAPAIREAPSRSTARRHSGSNVVYINGAPLCVGKLINVGNVAGVVRYIGTTRFATGTWVGIELCEQKGKNSGTVDGEKYFSCPPNHGIFIRASRLDLSVH